MNHNKTSYEKSIPSFKAVKEALDEIRPGIQADDGDITLEKINPNGTILVRFQGACVGCPSSMMTLKNIVEKHLKDRFEFITDIKAL